MPDTPPPSTAASEFTQEMRDECAGWHMRCHAKQTSLAALWADQPALRDYYAESAAKHKLTARIVRSTSLLSRLSAGSPDNSAAHGPKLVESTRVEEGTNTPQSKAGSTPAGGASERLSAGEGGPLVAEADDWLRWDATVQNLGALHGLIQRMRDELVRLESEKCDAITWIMYKQRAEQAEAKLAEYQQSLESFSFSRALAAMNERIETMIEEGMDWDHKCYKRIAELEAKLAEAERTNEAVQGLIEHLVVVDSYGVDGSEFDYCIACGGKRGPELATLVDKWHREDCPIPAISAGVSYKLDATPKFEVQRDARRYQWLRHCDAKELHRLAEIDGFDKFDAAIDAALRGGK